MINNNFNDVAKETITVLEYFDPCFVSKISSTVLSKLKNFSQASNLKIIIDRNKKLDEQNISLECKTLIGLMYYEYIANDDEKKILQNIWYKNEIEYQNKLQKKYPLDNLFPPQTKKNLSSTVSALPTIVSEESFFKKIVNYIHTFFQHLLEHF